MNKKSKSTKKKMTRPTEKDVLCKVGPCGWCDAKKIMTYRFINQYYQSYFCKECCELATLASGAADRDTW